jgi:hypothetical protein
VRRGGANGVICGVAVEFVHRGSVGSGVGVDPAGSVGSAEGVEYFTGSDEGGTVGVTEGCGVPVEAGDGSGVGAWVGSGVSAHTGGLSSRARSRAVRDAVKAC